MNRSMSQVVESYSVGRPVGPGFDRARNWRSRTTRAPTAGHTSFSLQISSGNRSHPGNIICQTGRLADCKRLHGQATNEESSAHVEQRLRQSSGVSKSQKHGVRTRHPAPTKKRLLGAQQPLCSTVPDSVGRQTERVPDERKCRPGLPPMLWAETKE